MVDWISGRNQQYRIKSEENEMNIAIDGPAGAGKSTIAKMVAEKLSYIYVDTGAMYRTIALYLLNNNISADKVADIEAALGDISISLAYENGMQQMYLNGENVSAQIRNERVGNMASKTSALPCVRAFLLELQRGLARENDVVMDGRDIGTNILPDAEVKVYLTASSSVRAKRRYDELVAKGETPLLDKIENDIIQRDYQDMHRDIAPLKQADDAVFIDSSDMSINEVADSIIKLTNNKTEIG